jgi:hypothetical protein
MAKPPKKKRKAPTESQLAVRRKFKLASRWAVNALMDPEKLAIYQAKASGMKTPYVIAIKDYLCPPEILEINYSNYNGNVGDKIKVVAEDDVKVKSVTVTITDKTGVMIETGPCIEEPGTDSWYFTATVSVADLAGVVISAVAEDIPSHTGTLDVTL